jgi:hypothetical protein
MSLLRLLTAGRSLVSVHDAETRYRLTTQRLLPQFGSANNPFRNRETPEPAPATTAGRAVGAAEATAKVPVSKTATSLWQKPAACLSAWTTKLIDRVTRPAPKPAKPAIPQFNKAPIQGEFSLDRVRVVRNDLSDADLEVVPARPKTVAAAVPPAPPANPPSALGRVATRLFGVGKS